MTVSTLVKTKKPNFSNLSNSEILKLSLSLNDSIRLELAKTPNLPLKAIKRLSRNENYLIRKTLIESQKLTKKRIFFMVKNYNESQLLIELISKDKISCQAIKLIYEKCKNELFNKNSDSLSVFQYERLHCMLSKLFINLARNKKTPSYVLHEIACYIEQRVKYKDYYEKACKLIINNPKTLPKTFKLLLRGNKIGTYKSLFLESKYCPNNLKQTVKQEKLNYFKK